MDPSVCSIEDVNNIYSTRNELRKCADHMTSLKMDHSKLQIKVEQRNEYEDYMGQESSTSYFNLNHKINMDEDDFNALEIKFKPEELIIKGEPPVVPENYKSLDIVKYDTNPATLGIRNLTANTEIKVDSSIHRIEDLNNMLTCYIEVIMLPEHVLTSIMELYLNSKLIVNQKDSKCNECGKCFTTLSNLNLHMRTHTNEKPFECSKCKKCFSQRGTLKNHMFIHDSEKSFQCQQCDRAFNFKSSLKAHMFTHTKDNPFRCHLCHKAFIRKYDIKRHNMLIHNKKPFKCEHCDKIFIYSSNLKAHVASFR